MQSWYAGRSSAHHYTMVSDPDEPDSEPTLSPRLRVHSKQRHSAGGWGYALATALKSIVAVCFLVFVGGQAAYVTPLYMSDIQGKVATWWGSHDEMVDPSYLLLVGVVPTLACVVVLQGLRRLRARRGVWSVATLLRRRPSTDWLSYGELLFLLFLVAGNALVFWFGFSKRHGHKPRFTGDPPHPGPPGPPSAPPYVRMIGNALGFNCVLNLALLFLPATRNSAWMEFMNISYANGIKFHRWLGVAAVLTGIVHCACYYYGWLQDGRWKQMALPCWDCSLRERTGRKIWVNVFGEVALLCFLFIGVTSVPWVRRRLYNLFYSVHQLLFVAVVFTVLHWARALWFLVPTFVAYLISRVLSHCSGSTAAKVVEFSALSPTLCKLVVEHSSSERGAYQVGQFVYVNVPAISRMEWHAFTIASSPKASSFDENSSNTVTLVIKALGDWTEKLVVYQQVCERCSIEPQVYVDGYYGASLAETYQAYNTVVLIGGGVGVTPLLGVLEDVCAAAETRQAQGRSALPRRVAALFVMRELELLKEMYPLLARVREVDPRGRFISVQLTLTTSPRPEELDASLCARMPSKVLPSDCFSQTRTFPSSTRKGCPVGASLGASDGALVQFVAFGVVVGLLLVMQLGNGALIGFQDSVWVVQLAAKTGGMFAAGITTYGAVVLTRWTQSARSVFKSWYFVDELRLNEHLLPHERDRSFSPGVSSYRDLVSELHVGVGRRPDIGVQLRQLHAGHRRRCSGNGSAIGVLVSGPAGLKTATARAAAAISARAFDIHEEEFEL
jgi:ferric-chelate reductase